MRIRGNDPFLNIFEEESNCLKKSNKEQEKQRQKTLKVGEKGNFKKKEVKNKMETNVQMLKGK